MVFPQFSPNFVPRQRNLSRDSYSCPCPGRDTGRDRPDFDSPGRDTGRDRENVLVPGQRDSGTSRPGLSRDVPRDVPFLGNATLDTFINLTVSFGCSGLDLATVSCEAVSYVGK